MAVRAAEVPGGDAGAVIEEMGPEEREPADVFRRLIRPGVQGRVGRRGVVTTQAIPRRIIGNERCLVELDGNPEEEREVVLDQRELLFGKVVVVVVLIYQSLGSVGVYPDELPCIPPSVVKSRLDHQVVSAQ